MATRLYLEFASPEAEASWFGITPSELEAARARNKSWSEADPGQGGDEEVWSTWYNSRSRLDYLVDDFETFGLGRVQVPLKDFGLPEWGSTHDPELMENMLWEQAFSSEQGELAEHALNVDGIIGLHWC